MANANRSSTGRGTTVLVIEPCAVMRIGLVKALGDAGPDIRVVGACESFDGDEALRLTTRLHPRVAIVDLCTHANDGTDPSGFALIKDLHRQSPQTRTLACAPPLSAPLVRHLFAIGAAGCIRADAPAEEWIAAVRTLAAGQVHLAAEAAASALSGDDHADPFRLDAHLSACELEVVRLIGTGQSTRAIAATLFKSVKTIETYRSRARGKLGLKDPTALAQWAWRFAHPTGMRADRCV